MAAAVTRDEFYALGARAECFRSLARPLESVSGSVLVLARHGLAEGTPLRLKGSDLPAPLLPGTLYYAEPQGGDLFRLRASPGGSAITLTDAGTGRQEIVEDIEPKIDAALDHWTGVFDEKARAHAGPWTEYPRIAKWIVSCLAAYDLLCMRGLLNPEFTSGEDGFKERWDRAWKLIADLRSEALTEGADATPGVAEMGATGFSADDEPAPMGAL